MEGGREFTKRVQDPGASYVSILAPPGLKGGLVNGFQSLELDVPQIQRASWGGGCLSTYMMLGSGKQPAYMVKANYADLLFLLSALLQGSSLTKPNWKPKVMSAHDVVHTGQAPKRKQGGERRKEDLDGTYNAGCVCEKSRLKPNPGSVRMAEEGKNSGEQTIVSTSLVISQALGTKYIVITYFFNINLLAKGQVLRRNGFWIFTHMISSKFWKTSNNLFIKALELPGQQNLI